MLDVNPDALDRPHNLAYWRGDAVNFSPNSTSAAATTTHTTDTPFPDGPRFAPPPGAGH